MLGCRCFWLHVRSKVKSRTRIIRCAGSQFGHQPCSKGPANVHEGDKSVPDARCRPLETVFRRHSAVSVSSAQQQRQTQLQMEQHQRYITSLLAAASGQLPPESTSSPAQQVRTLTCVVSQACKKLCTSFALPAAIASCIPRQYTVLTCYHPTRISSNLERSPLRTRRLSAARLLHRCCLLPARPASRRGRATACARR